MLFDFISAVLAWREALKTPKSFSRRTGNKIKWTLFLSTTPVFDSTNTYMLTYLLSCRATTWNKCIVIVFSRRVLPALLSTQRQHSANFCRRCFARKPTKAKYSRGFISGHASWKQSLRNPTVDELLHLSFSASCSLYVARRCNHPQNSLRWNGCQHSFTNFVWGLVDPSDKGWVLLHNRCDKGIFRNLLFFVLKSRPSE